QPDPITATAAGRPMGGRDTDPAATPTGPRARGAPPGSAGAAVAFECEVAEIKPYPAENPNCHLIFARVLLAHVDDAVLADERHVDSARLDLVGRLGGSHYSHTRDTFSMIRPR
ncbi:flavin reductase family protein, partial [Pseudomonas aeruginosa]